ncbi:type II toxin-antitoxin system VapB family antitoxin [Runella sp. MFBS21]|uniref:type II toxin-antitoxin system VapB family antitoxin n=1 Tax=Runella TaxID=105 RepID=UPI0003F6FA92|nr:MULTISPECIES: type II toxin-antitoxin system VapB family antitoxin [Runella]MDF7816878.1 type II toxin-antitoxin system VapB family antitoxin [Runella sp. MFBS21]
MKTTIDLPEDLIEEAMRITGSKSKIDAIKKALHELIEREKRLKLLNFKGKVDLDIDLNSLRDRASKL